MSKGNVYNKFFNQEIYDATLKENKDLLGDFLLELRQRKKSINTIRQYENDIKIIFIYIYKNLENKYILDLNKKDFRRYSLYLTSECGVSSARHNRLMSSVRSMLDFAEGEDEYEYENNVSKKVKGLVKESTREIFFLSNEQVMKLKEELLKREEYQKATLLMLAYDSAARRGELSMVEKYSFYDKSKSNTNKVIGKRRKIFSLIYFSETKKCAELWLKQRGEDNIKSLWVIGKENGKKPATSNSLYHWFIYMRNLLSEIENKTIDFNPHSIRHSCLQNLSDGTHYVCQELGISGGFPVEKLRLLANHDDVSTTSSYLKNTRLDELEEMFNIKII